MGELHLGEMNGSERELCGRTLVTGGGEVEAVAAEEGKGNGIECSKIEEEGGRVIGDRRGKEGGECWKLATLVKAVWRWKR